MGTKSQDVAIVAPICCAAAMVTSTRDALKVMAEGAPEERKGGPLHTALEHMTDELSEALDHLSAFRELYDQHLA